MSKSSTQFPRCHVCGTPFFLETMKNINKGKTEKNTWRRKKKEVEERDIGTLAAEERRYVLWESLEKQD